MVLVMLARTKRTLGKRPCRLSLALECTQQVSDLGLILHEGLYPTHCAPQHPQAGIEGSGSWPRAWGSPSPRHLVPGLETLPRVDACLRAPVRDPRLL